MAATLENLQPNTTYGVRAFIKTANETVYGDTREFTTEADPAGIPYVKDEAETPHILVKYGGISATDPAVQTAVYSLDGQMLYCGHAAGIPELKKGLYIVVITGETRKVMLR